MQEQTPDEGWAWLEFFAGDPINSYELVARGIPTPNYCHHLIRVELLSPFNRRG
jgi:hypothetical protein